MTHFIHTGRDINLSHHPVVTTTEIPPGFYIFNLTPAPSSAPYLEKSSPFILPDKLHGNLTAMSSRILSSFLRRKKNVGVLLSGQPGTGKSVQAKHIAVSCVEAGIPVITITAAYGGQSLNSLFERCDQPLCIVIDEFEKVYSDKDDLHSLLTVMDGMGSSSSPVLWVLTSNETNPSPFLISRPGRVRYRKSYVCLTDEEKEEIVTSFSGNLSESRYEELRRIVPYIDGLTVDSLTALIEEVQLYDAPVVELLELMNIASEPVAYECEFQGYRIECDNGEESPEISALLRELELPTYDVLFDNVWMLSAKQKDALVNFKDRKIDLYKATFRTYEKIHFKPDSSGVVHTGLAFYGNIGQRSLYGYHQVRGRIEQVIKRNSDGSLAVTISNFPAPLRFTKSQPLVTAAWLPPGVSKDVVMATPSE